MTTNPPAPLWLSVVRGIQLFLALVTLALSAYGISAIGSYSGYGLNIFTSVVTLFYIGYIVASTFFVESLFNIWIALGFQAFLAIFWLATFGTLAALAVSFGVLESYDGYSGGYYYSYTGNSDVSDYFRVVSATTKASTAFAAIVWVLFVATLIYTTISVVRHGRDTSAVPAATEEHKLDPVAGQPTPTSYQPVQQYAQQPQYAAPYAAPGAEYPPQQQQFQEQPTGYPQQQFQQPTAYPQQTGSPAPYQQTGSPASYPQQTGSPAPYQQAGSPAPYPQEIGSPESYPQQTGSPAPYQQTGSPAPYPQEIGSPAPGYVQQAPYPPQQSEPKEMA
ncbi:hypothetical protein V500_00857 [Pseudogymnoascus sp. VKM F-4518 (FW-2643)]|nr:hypothetical protein V500_00857 [Pseudogymnoascus sp. VKM F-4518 (FW-2643)]